MVETINKIKSCNCVLELEVDDIYSFKQTLEKHGIKAYVVKYEDAYNANPFLSTIVSLLDAHMAKCAVEFASSRGVSVHLVKSKGELYLLLIPI